MKTIIGFSGGLDSTYCLWKILSQTNDDVSIIILDTSNVTQGICSRYDLRSMSKVNDLQSSKIINWLQTNVRPFTVVQHQFDEKYVLLGIENVNSIVTYLTRYSVDMINSNQADRFVCSNEKENDGFSNGGTILSRRPGSIAAQEIFTSTAIRGSIEFPLIDTNYTQAVALAELPNELLVFTNPCIYGNEDFGCKKRQWFQSLLNEGKTQQEIYDVWYATCTQVPNKWFSMKFWLENISATSDKLWDIPQWPTSYTVS